MLHVLLARILWRNTIASILGLNYSFKVFLFLKGGRVLSSEGQVLNELKYVLSCGIFSALDLTRRSIMERDFCDKR